MACRGVLNLYAVVVFLLVDIPLAHKHASQDARPSYKRKRNALSPANCSPSPSLSQRTKFYTPASKISKVPILNSTRNTLTVSSQRRSIK